MKFPESPHLYRIGDDWYLLIAEGGTERGHAVSIARGPSPQVFFGRRQQHLAARIRATVSVVGTVGLEVRIDAEHSLGLECFQGRVHAIAVVGEIRSVLGDVEVSDDECDLEIRMTPATGAAFSTSRGPDRLQVGVNLLDRFVELGSMDGRYLSTEVAGGMTGRMIGVTCRSGDVLVRSLEYSGSDDATALFTGSDADVVLVGGPGAGSWATDLQSR